MDDKNKAPETVKPAKSDMTDVEKSAVDALVHANVELQKTAQESPVAPAPEEKPKDVKEFTVLRPFMHDGKVYGPGDRVSLSAATAEIHVSGGALVAGVSDKAAQALRDADADRLAALKASGSI